MSWLYYLLEANLYLILFYGFYRLFLYKETFYRLNRYYLIFSSILAFILPLFQLGFLKAPVIEQITIAPTTETVVSQVMMTENLPLESYQPSIFTIDNTIIAIYSLVTIAFLFKMLFNLSKIISMRKLPFVNLDNGVKLIDLKDSKIAFSFFHLLFLDPQLEEKNTILKHELVHIKQKHSLDVLLFEIIQIINWFNPIIYLVKKDIKLIHEYLADEETTKCDVEKYHYAMFLIQNSTGIQNLTLTNQIFSSSILKKRINMLNQKKSPRWARLKLLLVLPITIGILCISTMAFTKDYGFVELGSSLKLQATKQDTVKKAFESNDGIHVPNPNELYLALRTDPKNKKLTTYTKKLILLNGREIKAGTSGGVKKIKHMIRLNPATAKAKYGEKGSYGAIEIFSSNPEIIGTPPEVKLPLGSSQKIVILPPAPPIGEDTTKRKKLKKINKVAIKTKTVQGYPTVNKNKTIEIKPIPQSNKNLNEVTIKAYEKAKGAKSDSDIKEIKLQDNSPTKEKGTITYAIVVHQDNLDKAKNEKLVVDIPEGATAELTIFNVKYDKALYQSTNYKNDWDAKELSNGNYPYNFAFVKNGKRIGGKTGYVQIK
ncbi:M56 family metallopeptidase [Pedobacter psychrodurus]|nr:M56 family metallopeptidase [Pedobacter psychrodurus]